MEEVLYKLHFDDLEVTSLVSEPWELILCLKLKFQTTKQSN